MSPIELFSDAFLMFSKETQFIENAELGLVHGTEVKVGVPLLEPVTLGEHLVQQILFFHCVNIY